MQEAHNKQMKKLKSLNQEEAFLFAFSKDQYKPVITRTQRRIESRNKLYRKHIKEKVKKKLQKIDSRISR